MTAKQHESKYLYNKKFFKSGINNKDEYTGWYVVAMQNAVYHLMSMYHAKRGKKNIPHEHMGDIEYFPGDLKKELYNPYHTLRNSKETALYGALAVTKKEVAFADEVFPKFEKHCYAMHPNT